MPSQYQRDNLEAILGLFLEAQGHPLPQHSKTKSASALSRFLNIYSWSTRKLIYITRNYVLKKILSHCPQGRRPMLQVIIDLTTLEKCGKFKAFEHLISVYNSKRGLHLVVLYLVVGWWRVPWSFRVWRGNDTPSPALLGLKLVKGLNNSRVAPLLGGDDVDGKSKVGLKLRSIVLAYTVLVRVLSLGFIVG